jgi:hypothetical protein
MTGRTSPKRLLLQSFAIFCHLFVFSDFFEASPRSKEKEGPTYWRENLHLSFRFSKGTFSGRQAAVRSSIWSFAALIARCRTDRTSHPLKSWLDFE